MSHNSKRFLTGLVFLLSAGLPAISADEPRPVKSEGIKESAFGSDRTWEFVITIPTAEYAAMQPIGGYGGGPPRQQEKEAPKRESHRSVFGTELPWAKGTVTVDGKTFDGVGIRYKGNGTIGDTARTIKKSFKIDLDRFGGEEAFRGQKTLNLHCDVTDPSRLRETLAYELYRAAGVPASRTAWAEVRLTVPGKFDKELLGVYTLVEQVNKSFQRDHFKTDKGLLMKPEGLRDFEYRGDNWEQYKKAYAPRRDATASESKQLIAFAKLVSKAEDADFRREIDTYLDIDNYLRFLATTAYLSNTDSFFGLGHNYYMHLHPETKKLSFIPWDLDRAFANFGNARQNMDLSLTHPYAGNHRLTERLLAMPEMAKKYQTLLKELATGPFAKDRLLKELATLEKTTKAIIERDAKAAANRKEVTTGPRAPGLMFGQPPALTTFIEKRTESVAEQLAGKRTGFIPNAGPFGGR